MTNRYRRITCQQHHLETLVGVALFGRTMSDTLAGLATPAGLIGLTAQVIAALLPLFVGRRA